MNEETSEQSGATLTEYDLFVDGRFRESTGEDRITVGSPYDGEAWATSPTEPRRTSTPRSGPLGGVRSGVARHAPERPGERPP